MVSEGAWVRIEGLTSNQSAAANRRYAIEFASHWFYNITGLRRTRAASAGR